MERKEVDELVKVKLAYALMFAGIPVKRGERLDDYVRRGLRVFRVEQEELETVD